METLILTALCELYERLLADPDSGVAKPGYCENSAVAALEISRDGQLVRAVPLGTRKGQSIVGLKMKVPDRVNRTAGDDPNFLCDNVEYLLGVRAGWKEPDDRASGRHMLAKTLHEQVLAGLDDDGARAVLGFLSEWNPGDYQADPRLKDAREALDSGRNIVFRLEGDDRFVHDRPRIMRVWEAFKASPSAETTLGQCLVTGEYGPIALLHKSISGIAGAQRTGARVVSFNFGATESYGKKDGANSPVGERAAFAYGTVLNWLTSSERHHLLVGDTTVVFWAERACPEENLLLQVFPSAVGRYQGEEAQMPDGEAVNDESTAGKMNTILEHLLRGRYLPGGFAGFDSRVRFYILGLAPNNARISVRFWHVDTFGGLLENFRKHFEDMAMVCSDKEDP